MGESEKKSYTVGAVEAIEEVSAHRFRVDEHGVLEFYVDVGDNRETVAAFAPGKWVSVRRTS